MIKRLFVEKKRGYDVGAKNVYSDIVDVLGIAASELRLFLRYDIENIDGEVYESSKNTIFSEPPVDNLYETELPNLDGYTVITVEYLPGQYDQRADSAMQCVQLLSRGERPIIKCATVYAVKGCGKEEIKAISAYLINPVECREGSEIIPSTLKQSVKNPGGVPLLAELMQMNGEELINYHAKTGLAMSVADLAFVKSYFEGENRVPTQTELKVIDTYWSDHCRHTTFNTEITDIKISSDNKFIHNALKTYNELYAKFNGARKDKYKCLMDAATIAVKELKSQGKLNNLDTSDEINACSVSVDVDVDGKPEEWLIMFKNETHNHPTEIEPFGGAATCLGGAIRDPLSGRTYVYQAMRVTGSADPTVNFKDTLIGKLPQRVITKTAAAGYSSYGNQIGLATGLVSEMYHEGYKAKRLETGFVIAGAPKENIVRRKPIEGDVIVLLGGDTGRDGCGGATGSSKAHTEKSVEDCGAEVQKGNALTERKIQRLFRDKKAANLIVKCNDFGAGGVSVAIGELADSLDIDLDAVPKKYEGLSGTELAISESQERMAVVLAKETVDTFIRYAHAENLIATPVAVVTDTGRLRMMHNGKIIVDLARVFLDTNGVKQTQDVKIVEKTTDYLSVPNKNAALALETGDYAAAITVEAARLNVCGSRGLGEIFDSTIGAGTVLMPFGGKRQLTPSIVMAAKPPVSGYTRTVTACSYACSPDLMSESPFVGSVYSVTASVSKLIAAGVPLSSIRLTLQEYFKKLGKDSERWGEPTSALLGAMTAQLGLGTAAIGGKDSMSGSFENIDVPPTLISFAVGVTTADNIISNVFSERAGGDIYYVELPCVEFGMPDFQRVLELYSVMEREIASGRVKACNVTEEGGAVMAAVKSALGNAAGLDFIDLKPEYFAPKTGSFVFQAESGAPFDRFKAVKIAVFNGGESINAGGKRIKLKEINAMYENTLENVFPTTANAEGNVSNISFFARTRDNIVKGIAKPRVLIPVFPGTNCEYDTAEAFKAAGAIPEIFIVKNQSSKDIDESVKALAEHVKQANILAFPGGFSGGDEPDGSGKFIATTFRNTAIADAVAELLNVRDGLIIGICNGFQALIKLGLVPYGVIAPQTEKAPTLTFNNINRHVSTIARIRVATNKSPWLSGVKVGDIFSVPVSHGEGRFVASEEELEKIIKSGQVATQYVDLTGNATMVSPYNPNGSMCAVEGIISPCGRVLGKMGHAERYRPDLYKNVEGNYDMKLFESGVDYFK